VQVFDKNWKGSEGMVPLVAVKSDELDRLIAQVKVARGIDLRSYRRTYLERRLATRLRALGIESAEDYCIYLVRNKPEYDRLLESLSISVTEFFRDPKVWDMVRHRMFPELIEAKHRGRSRMIRGWSAGCATGEEPYSLAMCALDALGGNANRFHVSVLATDVDDAALAKAHAGRYPSAALRRIPAMYQQAYTRLTRDGEIEISPEIRKLVRWKHYSLFDDAPMRLVDVVFCRNVMIYLDRDQQDRVLDVFWDALARGGYLVLGRSERLTPAALSRFEVVDGRERIYRKPSAI
jgi:chemotaxis methyl-accepting protein methylase